MMGYDDYYIDAEADAFAAWRGDYARPRPVRRAYSEEPDQEPPELRFPCRVRFLPPADAQLQAAAPYALKQYDLDVDSREGLVILARNWVAFWSVAFPQASWVALVVCTGAQTSVRVAREGTEVSNSRWVRREVIR